MNYTEFASYYDQIHAGLVVDLPFLTTVSQQHGLSVLELGCGSGRILVPLAHAGLAVWGVDNSAEMLHRAQAILTQKSLTNASLIEADMTTFRLEKTDFDTCIIGYNTLMHLNANQLSLCLQQIHQHSRDGALLIVDTANPFWLAEVDEQTEYEEETSFTDEDSGLEVVQFSRFRPNKPQSVLQVDWLFEREDGFQVPAKTVYHYHFPHILELIMRNRGFVWQVAFGDYDSAPFYEDSERLIILAEKR